MIKKHEVLHDVMNDIKNLIEATGSTKSNNIPNNNTHSNSTCNEIIIDGIFEDRSDFTSNVEAEEAQVSEILEYFGESNINISQMYRLGKSKNPQNEGHVPYFYAYHQIGMLENV